MNWFEVDKDGLAQIMERRGMAFVPMELLQNAWDEDVTEVTVLLEPIEDRRMACRLIVTDDSPDGFRDLRDAWTLFAASYKKDNADKRGRFNLGEKLVLAVCHSASITSTTGGVSFDSKGRHNIRKGRATGTQFLADVRMSREHCAEALEALQRVIPPEHCQTVVNGRVLAPRVPKHVFKAQLLTEVADEEGVLRRRKRTCQVEVHEPRPGEMPALYELGIPVQATGDRWHINVLQCVPLTLERDAVPPAYLAKLRALVVNAMHQFLTEEDASEPWVRAATNHPKASTAAMERALDLRFGQQRVMVDPSDPEASKRAHAAGYTVVHPRQLGQGERGHLKRIDRDEGRKLVAPAGRVFPTRLQPVPGELMVLARKDWAVHHQRIARLTTALADHLLDYEVQVHIVRDEVGDYAATYRRGVLTFNEHHLRARWWQDQSAAGWDSVVELIIHELAHHYCSDHLSDAYHAACCCLGAKLARVVAMGWVQPQSHGYELE